MVFSTLIALVVVTLIAFLGSRHGFQRQIANRGLYYFFLTGTEYIFIGLILGPSVLNVVSERVIQALSPFIIFGLAFVGFIAGSQLEWHHFKNYPRRLYSATLLIDLVTFLVVITPFYLIFDGFGLSGNDLHHPIIIIAISALGTFPSSTLMILQRFKRFRSLPNLLQFIAGFGDLILILFFGIMFSFEDLSSQHVSLEHSAGYYWVFLSFLLGGIMGVAFYSALNIRQSRNEYLALLIGLLAFTGGLSAYLHLSPIFVAAIAGVTYSNLPKIHTVASAPFVLARVEKPVYFVLLILAGALWTPEPLWAFPLALLYCLLRIIGKVLGGYLVYLGFPANDKPPKWLGIGLTAHGGVVIAVIINYQLGFTGESISTSVTIMLTAVVIHELTSPTMLNFLCKRESEK